MSEKGRMGPDGTTRAVAEARRSRSEDAVWETVRMMWPEADVQVRTGDRRASSPSEDLHIVPNARKPRLLIPGSRRAAGAAMRRFSAALGPVAGVSRRAAAMAIGLAPSVLFPDRLVISAHGGDNLVDHLAGVLGGPVMVSVGVGSDRINRKPVVGVYSPQGEALAFAKLGHTATSASLVESEARALATLATAEWSVVRPPALLHFGQWRGMNLLVMSALPTRVHLSPRDRSRIPHDVISEISLSFTAPDTPLGGTPLMRRLRKSLKAMPASAVQDAFAAAMSRLDDRFGDQQVRVGAWHGDLAPWNVSLGRDRASVWDWERFETGVPVGLDRLHYTTQTTVASSGFDPAAVAAGLRRAETDDRHHQYSATRAAYLAALAERYLVGAAGHPDTDGRFIAMATDILTLLESDLA